MDKHKKRGIKMQSLIDNPPRFLRTEDQFSYYNEIIDLLAEHQVPITTQDTFSLGVLALNLSLLDECADSIAEEGMLMKVQGDRHEISKVNPAVALQKEAQTAIRFYCKEFGMSPNSRGKGLMVKPLSGDKKDGFEDL
jgi:P27 family predicted phage terminase small subunit